MHLGLSQEKRWRFRFFTGEAMLRAAEVTRTTVRAGPEY